MTTPIDLCARLWDVDLGAVAQVTTLRSDLARPTPTVSTVTVPAVATKSMIAEWQRSSAKDKSGHIRLRVTLGNAFASGVIAAFGGDQTLAVGATYLGPYKRYLVQLSYKGNVNGNYFTACWLENVTVNLAGSARGIVIDTQDIFSGFERTDLDHTTYDGVTLAEVLNAPAGQIKVPPDPLGGPGTGTTARSGTYYPGNQRGLSVSVPMPPSAPAASRALATWQFQADTALANFSNRQVSGDSWGDSVATAALTFIRAAAGKYDALDPAPIGARGHFHVDLLNRVLRCGYVGTQPKITLMGALPAGTYEPDQTTTAVFNGSALQIQAGIEKMMAQAQFLGGGSNHGLPDGFSFTGIDTILRGNGITWYTNLLLVAVSTGNDGGGVYYMPHDGACHPLSQVFDVHSMAQDGTALTMYAGTDHGVFNWPIAAGSLPAVNTWAKVGGLTAKVLQVQIPAANIIWALADTGQGTTGIFQYPAIGGEDNTSLGFAGWSRIAQGGNILSMAGGIGNLYYTDAADPTVVVWQHGGTATKIQIPNGAGVTGIDYLPTLVCVVIRTTAGSAGLYSIDLTSGTLTTLNPGGFVVALGGLADSFGPLVVNRISQCDARTLNGSVITLLAATDQGPYWTGQAPGDPALRWQRMGAQSGVGDKTVTLVCASQGQTILGRTVERVYACSDKALYVSNSGGLWFYDLTNAPLDLGPFWYEIGRATIGHSYPGNDVGAIGNGDASLISQNGGSGTVIQYNGAYKLPNNWVWARRLTLGRNDFTYRLVQVDSPAPYFAIDQQDLAEITADDARGAITASEQLALAHWRVLAEQSLPSVTLPLTDMSYRIQEAVLPTLVTGDLVYLAYGIQEIGPDGTITQVCNFGADGVARWYVQQYDEVLTNGIMKVSLTVGTIMSMVDDAIEQLREIVAGTSQGLNRDKRYRRVR